MKVIDQWLPEVMVDGRGNEETEHKGFLGLWKYFGQYYSDGICHLALVQT